MDQQQLDAIIAEVLRELSPAPAMPARPETHVRQSVPPVAAHPAVDTGVPDLTSDAVRKYVGVKDPGNPSVIKELRGVTLARVGVGRAGPRPRTVPYLRFLADHSLSRDTVFKEVPEEWITRSGLFMVQTKITGKDEYLTRPDLGRVLSDEGRKRVETSCRKNPQVQVVLSDGLSTDALTANYDEILPPLVKGLESAGLTVGTTFFVKYGRVKVEDEIGEITGADVVVLLIGERPGLGQSESMSAYMIYRPSVANSVESDRMVISNIHRYGTPPVEASAVIVDLVKKMIAQKTSGIHLKK